MQLEQLPVDVAHSEHPSQLEHVVVIPPREYVKLPQAVQSPLEYLYPASHPLHFPVVTTQPEESQTDGHDEHSDAPPVEYVPLEQSLQLSAPSPEYFPAGHDVQTLSFNFEYDPP